MGLGKRFGPVATVLATVLLIGLLNACSSSPQPQTTASAYFAAWFTAVKSVGGWETSCCIAAQSCLAQAAK